MGGERAILQPAGGEEPATAVGFERERIGARVQLDTHTLLLRRRIGRFFERKIRDVFAGPLASRRVPPDVLLPLRPGPAGGVRRGAVIEDAPVRGPGETPLRI